jgi:glycosyltransferase involved in cell wall biosynthesis
MPTPIRALTTVFLSDLPKDCPWRAQTDLVDPRKGSLRRRLWTLLRRAPRYDIVILNGASRQDQIAAMLLRRLRPSVPLLITDCQWKLDEGLAARVNRIGVRLLEGPRTFYQVASSDDEASFPEIWHVDPARVFTAIYFPAMSDEEMRAPVSEQGYVFAGGDSLRDYRTLIEAAKRVPFEVKIATNLPAPDDGLSENVTYGPLSREDYLEGMLNASVIVVALMDGTARSAGQTTYQVTRAMGKLVLANDVAGVGDYLQDRENGLVVPSGDAEALAEKLKWALDPANAAEVREIRETGKREVLEHHTKVDHTNRLLEIASEAVGRAA